MSSFFPFITNEELNDSEKKIPIYKEIAWDFINDKMILENGSPKIVEYNEAIKVWIYKTIKTERYNYPIYTWNYGCEVPNLLGKGLPRGLLISETARYIEESLLINPYITSLNGFDIQFNNETLSVNCNISTVYGEMEVTNFEI